MSLHATQRLSLPHASALSHKVLPISDLIKMRWAQIVELAGSKGWTSVLKEMVFLNRLAVVVEKDLSEIKERPEILAKANLRVVEIDEKMLTSGAFHFAIRSRALKAAHYLELGYGGIALTRGNEVIADTWYIVPEATANPRDLHPDLRRFGFKSWVRNHVYTFDIFLAPGERKGGISAAFQNSAMLMLRAKGYTKAFGYYWADNLPAHWCTRVTNKWQKVREVCISRFFLFTRATLPQPQRKKIASTSRKVLGV